MILYFYATISMLLMCQNCFAMENQTTRQRATTALTIKVFTKEERERSRQGRQRASTTADITPRSHKKNFTELYDGLGLSPRSQEQIVRSAASKSYIPEYMQDIPQLRTRTPRGSIVVERKEEIKFTKQQNKSCCTIL